MGLALILDREDALELGFQIYTHTQNYFSK